MTSFQEQCQLASEKGFMYLIHNIDDRGKFVYQRGSDGKKISGKYNILRHLGSIWACRQLMNNKNSLTEKTYLFANDRLSKADLYPAMVIKGDDTYFISEKGYAKLGANALAILAYGGMGVCNRGRYIPQLINGIKRMINIYTGDPIVSKMKLEDNSISPFVSDYYPGEAILALATQHDYKLAYKIVDWLYTIKYREKVLHDHWLLQGLEVLHRAASKDSKNFMMSFSKLISNEIINNPKDYMGHCTRMSCRVEGLISCYEMKPDPEILVAIQVLLSHILTHQCPNVKSPAYGAFGDNGIYQIDYTQHALSALNRYANLTITI